MIKWLNPIQPSCIFLAVITSVVVPAAAQQSSQGRIEFASVTPNSMFDLARERRQIWKRQGVWGDLNFPEGSAGKVPAIVLMHGSGGIEASMSQWVNAFNEIGVATFVVSSFAPRGVSSTVDDQTLVPAAANLADALHALELLADQPRIDPSRIGIMGFSRGGSVAFQSAIEPLRRAIVKSDLKFAFHISAYGGCNQFYWSPQISTSPILSLVGEADDYTTAASCEMLAARYAAAGATIRSIKYAGAHHSWDGMYPVHALPNATTAVPCGPIRWDIDTWKITSERNGEPIPPERLDAFFGTCMRRGVHAGRNELAFQQARKDAQEFVKQVVLATPVSTE
jgi:dienelactone hydrolase